MIKKFCGFVQLEPEYADINLPDQTQKVVHESNKTQEYKLFFQQVEEEARNTYKQSKTLLEKNDIYLLGRSAHQRNVVVSKIERGGAVVTFQVRIGVLALNVVMLNMDWNSRQSEKNVIAKGSFGEILEADEGLVAKRYLFRDQMTILKIAADRIDWKINGTQDEVTDMVFEFAINKICSALRIGPRVGGKTPLFDLVCSNDSIEYYMEKCSHKVIKTEQYSVERLKRRLKYCLRVMHLLQLVHNDIKPANILFSKAYGDFVLADFGLTAAINEQQGLKTKTYRQGTLRYMSPEMVSLKKGCLDFVDLYYNDMWGLSESLAQIQGNFQLNRKEDQVALNFPERSLLKAIQYAFYIYNGQPTSQLQVHQKTFYKKLSCYFPELVNQPKRKIEGKAQFFIRSVGLKDKLSFYIDSCPPSSKLDALKRKLLHCGKHYEQNTFKKQNTFRKHLKIELSKFDDFQNQETEQKIDRSRLLILVCNEHIENQKYQQFKNALFQLKKCNRYADQNNFLQLIFLNQILEQKSLNQQILDEILKSASDEQETQTFLFKSFILCFQHLKYVECLLILQRLFKITIQMPKLPITEQQLSVRLENFIHEYQGQFNQNINFIRIYGLVAKQLNVSSSNRRILEERIKINEYFIKSKSPSLRSFALMQTGLAYQQLNSKKSLAFYLEAQKFLKLLYCEFDEEIFVIRRCIAYSHYKSREIEKCLQITLDILDKMSEEKLNFYTRKTCAEIRKLTAICYYELKNYKEATSFFQKAVDIVKDTEYHQFMRYIQVKFLTKIQPPISFKDEINILESICKDCKGSEKQKAYTRSLCLHSIAQTYLKLHNYQKALEKCHQVTVLCSIDTGMERVEFINFYLMMILYCHLKKIEEAFQFCKKAQQNLMNIIDILNSQTIFLHIYICSFMTKLNREQFAQKSFQMLQKILEHNEQILLHDYAIKELHCLCIQFYKLKRYDKSIKIASLKLKLRPTCNFCPVIIGLSWFEYQEYEKSNHFLSSFAESIINNSKSYPELFALGKDIKQFNYGIVFEKIAFLLDKQGKQIESLKVVQEYIKFQEQFNYENQNWISLNSVSRALAILRRYEEALRKIQEAVIIRQQTCPQELHIAYYDAGMYNKILKNYRKAIYYFQNCYCQLQRKKVSFNIPLLLTKLIKCSIACHKTKKIYKYLIMLRKVSDNSECQKEVRRLLIKKKRWAICLAIFLQKLNHQKLFKRDSQQNTNKPKNTKNTIEYIILQKRIKHNQLLLKKAEV